MISRRAALGGVAAVAGVGVWGAHREGVLDNALRGVGVRPHPEPDPGDVQRLTSAAEGTRSLQDAVVSALGQGELDDEERRFLLDAQRVLRHHAHAVSAPTSAAAGSTGGSTSDVVSLARTTADQRAADAAEAVGTPVAQVLASMAAGLDQLAESGEKAT